ncbi:MAG TPA: HAD family phosphatase, partial [Armatimonadota bacterium]|nr:HAD family phosphatase [Armatimonadota bacterium]
TMTDAFFWKTFGMTNELILPMLFERPLSEAEMRAIAERKEEIYREMVSDHMEPLPGVVALLHSLHDAGFKVALGSSAPKANIDVVLTAMGVAPLFDAAICSDDVHLGKPHPEIFLKAAEALEIPPACCVVVEDAVVGLQAARAAGMHCLTVTNTHPREKLAGADRVVDSLEEVNAADFRALLENTCK